MCEYRVASRDGRSRFYRGGRVRISSDYNTNQPRRR